MARRTAHPDSTFSYAFGITPRKKDDWFDPALHADTALFVDPFVMFNQTSGRWGAVHDRIIDFFNEALGLIAESGGDHRSQAWRRAAAMFSFPEPPQFCLGYSTSTIFGAGSGPGLGQGMLASAERAVRAGIKDINDFGEVMIFGENFGADRISDMTCNIVMDLFVAYTQNVATRHGLPTQSFTLPHLGYDFAHGRWNRKKVLLPRNPCWLPPTAVLLVPDEFVIDLPKMDDGAFWDWVYNNFNEQLRSELNITLDTKIDKKGIIARAKQQPRLARRFGIEYEKHYRARPPKPYDLGKDPKGLTKPIQGAQTFAREATGATPESPENFCGFVHGLATDFKWVAEERGLARNFWAGRVPLHEDKAQNLFHGAVVLRCRDLDIDVSPESNAGRGPVDFKFSAGWARRGLVEIKFASTSSFWDNLERQPDAYAISEGVSCAVMLVVQHHDRHCTGEFMAKTREIVAAVGHAKGFTYDVVFVDVRPKPPPSKLKKNQPT